MANETFIKPHAVTFDSLEIKKVDRVDTSESGGGKPFYGDNATWPTHNKSHQRNARITIQTRDHASYEAMYVNRTGNLVVQVLNAKTGAMTAKPFANLIVKPGSCVFGGDVELATIVLEVEAEDGVTGPWS